MPAADTARRLAVKENRKGIPVPNVRPLLGSLAVGADSTIWVGLYRSSLDSTPASDPWYVLRGDGAGGLVRLEFPAGTRIFEVTSDHVLATHPGTYGVPVVVVYERTDRNLAARPKS